MTIIFAELVPTPPNAEFSRRFEEPLLALSCVLSVTPLLGYSVPLLDCNISLICSQTLYHVSSIILSIGHSSARKEQTRWSQLSTTVVIRLD